MKRSKNQFWTGEKRKVSKLCVPRLSDTMMSLHESISGETVFHFFGFFSEQTQTLGQSEHIFACVFHPCFPDPKSQTPWWLISGEMSDGSMAWRMAWWNGQTWRWLINVPYRKTQRNDSTISIVSLAPCGQCERLIYLWVPLHPSRKIQDTHRKNHQRNIDLSLPVNQKKKNPKRREEKVVKKFVLVNSYGSLARSYLVLSGAWGVVEDSCAWKLSFIFRHW